VRYHEKIILGVFCCSSFSACAQFQGEEYKQPTSLELSRTSLAIKGKMQEQELDGQLRPYRIAVQGADAATIEKLYTMIGNKKRSHSAR
jgi:hypothetical protein